MATLVQHTDAPAWTGKDQAAGNGVQVHAPASRSDRDFELWDKTDRLLRFPARHTGSGLPKAVSNLHAEECAARTQWLAEHDIHTEFVDAGIGCCWFAQQGDREPATGETEDEAIARVAAENGLSWENRTTAACRPSNKRSPRARTQ